MKEKTSKEMAHCDLTGMMIRIGVTIPRRKPCFRLVKYFDLPREGFIPIKMTVFMGKIWNMLSTHNSSGGLSDVWKNVAICNVCSS